MTERWLSIVGIGEDGRAGLTAAALAILDTATLVIGGRRHLDLVGPTPGEQRTWSVPLEATIPIILERRGRPVCVLASGDPFWFGAGVTLAREISIDEMLVLPAPSSLSLAAARMGWALQDTVTLGLNMRGLTPLVRRHLHDGGRILALSLNGETPSEVAKILRDSGFGASTMWVLEALGGARQSIRKTTADTFDLGDIDPLNIIAIQVQQSLDARPISYVGGLPDEMFEHDGQLTKREIRAVTMSSLAPAPRALLWDIGLGSGSVAIEWLLSHPSARAIGFERDPVRAARAARNAVSLGVPHLAIKLGAAIETLADVEPPDAIFIGGGASEPGLIEACWSALKPGGRIVINAVTLETEVRLIAAHASLGGTVTRISIDRAESVGSKHGWRPAMPVVQWVGTKP